MLRCVWWREEFWEDGACRAAKDGEPGRIYSERAPSELYNLDQSHEATAPTRDCGTAIGRLCRAGDGVLRSMGYGRAGERYGVWCVRSRLRSLPCVAGRQTRLDGIVEVPPQPFQPGTALSTTTPRSDLPPYLRDSSSPQSSTTYLIRCTSAYDDAPIRCVLIHAQTCA